MATWLARASEFAHLFLNDVPRLRRLVIIRSFRRRHFEWLLTEQRQHRLLDCILNDCLCIVFFLPTLHISHHTQSRRFLCFCCNIYTPLFSVEINRKPGTWFCIYFLRSCRKYSAQVGGAFSGISLSKHEKCSWANFVMSRGDSFVSGGGLGGIHAFWPLVSCELHIANISVNRKTRHPFVSLPLRVNQCSETSFVKTRGTSLSFGLWSFVLVTLFKNLR